MFGQTNQAVGYLRRQYAIVLRRCGIINALPFWAAFGTFSALMAGSATAEVVTDGRSATQLIRSGAVTDIRTGTISNGIGINSFSRFNVLSGEIANLFVPDSTNALVNIVRDQTVTINGMVNSYKNGHIGGNVFFASPNGFVVGQSGVINVGRLTVTTPTREFTDRLLDGSGRVDQAALQQLRDGAAIPLSSSGLISIQGGVNALEGVRLDGSQVQVDAQAQITAGHQAVPRIEELVNTRGLTTGGALLARDGEIVIVAAGDVTIQGTVRADGQAGVVGGRVDIHAGHDVLVDGGRVSASGLGDASSGGRIRVMAEHDATVRGGGVVVASAGTRGDGGALEFSGKNTVYWADGRLEASAHGGGALGEILIDPTDFVQSASQYTDGANLTLQADNSITVSPDVVLSTRKTANGAADNQATAASVGNSGKLTIMAPRITLGDGAKLYAQADNGYTAGDVGLIANVIRDASSGTSITTGTAEAKIVVGKNVDIFGNKVSLSVLSSIAPSTAAAAGVVSRKDADGQEVVDPVTIQAMLDSGLTPSSSSSSLGDSLSGILGENGLLVGVQNLSSRASIDVGDGVRIQGKGDVGLAANSFVTANASVTGLAFGALVTKTQSNASVSVGNATITSTAGKVDIHSVNSNTIKTTLDTMVVTESLPLALGAMVNVSEGAASTQLAAGSVVTAAKSVSIGAEQDKNYNMALKAGGSKGAVAIGVLVDTSNLLATTKVAGHVTSGEDMSLYANLETQKNTISDGILIGETLTTRANRWVQDTTGQTKMKDAVSKAMVKLIDKLGEKAGKPNLASGPSNPHQFFKDWGIVGAVSVVDQSNEAHLTVNSSAVLKAGTSLVVSSHINDYLNTAVSAVTSPLSAKSENGKTTTGPNGKKNGVAVSVLVSSQQNQAITEVQDGAQLDARHAMIITSTADLPYGAATAVGTLATLWTDPRSPFGGVSWTDKLTDGSAWNWLGQQFNDFQLASTWTQSSVSVGTSNAPSLDSGVNVSGSVAVTELGLKSRTLVGNGVRINQDASYRTLNQDVNVESKTRADLVNMVGDPLTLFGKSGDGASSGVGASVGYNDYVFAAETSVGNALITGKKVSVKSDNNIFDVSGAVSGASSGNNALGGSVLLNFFDSTSNAHLGAGAVVNAGDGFILQALDELFYIGLGGAVMSSSANSFGFSVAYANVERNTEAAIIGTANGSITAAHNLLVKAENSGWEGSFAVAAAKASNPTSTSVAQPDTGATGAEAPSEVAEKTKSADNGQQGAKAGVTISGAAAVNDITEKAVASVGGGMALHVTGVNARDAIDVLGHNATYMMAIAPAVSYSSVSGGGNKGMAGSYAQNTVSNQVQASVDSTGAVSVAAGALNITADNSVGILSIAAGASGSVGQEGRNLAGSVTYNHIDSTVAARLSNATTVDVAQGDMAVRAVDDADIIGVAGAVAFGGKGGYGAGVSVNRIGSHVSATVENVDVLSVGADKNVLITAESTGNETSVAASLAYSNQGYAVSGAVAYNTIDVSTTSGLVNSHVTAGGDVRLRASSNPGIYTVAGQGALSVGGGGVGASAAYNAITSSTTAAIQGGSVNAGRAVGVDAEQGAQIQAIAAGASVAGGKLAFNGSVAINTIDNDSTAAVVGANVASVGQIDVQAHDASSIEALTGGLALSVHGAGVGIAGSYNEIRGDVLAHVSGASLTSSADSVRLDAKRDQSIRSLSAGVGGSSDSAGIAGSVSVNRVLGSTGAVIDNDSTVVADNNVLVQAQADSQIKTLAGALGLSLGQLGAGGAVEVNGLESSTFARIEGAGTRVIAKGYGAAMQVDNGQLGGSTSDDLQGRRQIASTAGVAVIASSTDDLTSVAFSAGLSSSVGIAGAVTVNILGGSTTAQVNNAAINSSTAGADVDQSVVVGAYHHVDVDDYTAVAGGGSSAGVGVAIATNVLEHRAVASTDGATLRARHDVTVTARETGTTYGLVAGLGGGGTAGVNGSVAVNVIQDEARATVNNSTLAGMDHTRVLADSDHSAKTFVGSIGAGGTAGVGVSLAVTVADASTVAETTGSSHLESAGETRVQATAQDEYRHTLATAGVAGTAGIAASVSVLTSNATTRATVGGTTQINDDAAYASAAQDVAVDAQQQLTTKVMAGSAGAAGTVGVGAAMDVQVLRSGASAQLAAGSNVKATRALTVDAKNQRDISSLAAALGGGGVAGVGAGISVVSVSSAAASEANKVLENKLGDATTSARDNGLGSQMGSSYSGASALSNTAAGKQQSVNPNASYTSALDGTRYSAAARASGTVDAGSLRVSADNRSDVESKAYGVAGAGVAGAGAGVSVVTVGDQNLAEVAGTAKVANALTVQSLDHQNQATLSKAWAGAGGGTAGIGAAVAVASKTSTSTARVASGAQVNAGGQITLEAELAHALHAQTANLALGGIAGVGVAVATAHSSGTALTQIGSAAVVRGAAVRLTADVLSDNDALAMSASGGGLGAANAAVGTAQDDTVARALIENGSTVMAVDGANALGDITLTADTHPHARSRTYGAALAGAVAAGAAVSVADVDTTAQARAGNANLIANNLSITASANKAADGSARGNAEALGVSGSGGVLVGINATVSTARTTTHVDAQVADGASLSIGSNVTVLAQDKANADARATGIAVGAIGVGAAVADVEVQANDTASFGGHGLIGKTLSVSTDGDNTVSGDTTAGSGGLIAGAASIITGHNTGVSTARVTSAANVTAGEVDITASRKGRYDFTANALQASLVGASGTKIDQTTNTTTVVDVQAGAQLASMGDLRLRAYTFTGGSARAEGGSGGVAAGSAVLTDTSTTTHTRVDVGSNAVLVSGGDIMGTPGSLMIDAQHEQNTRDHASLSMIAAVGGPYGEGTTTSTQGNQVNIGAGAKLSSNGLLGIGTLGKTAANAFADVSVAGVAALGGGKTKSVANTTEAVNIGDNAELFAYGNLRVGAGVQSDGNVHSSLGATARTMVVNNTVVPITAELEAEAEARTLSALILGTGVKVTSVRNVDLESSGGSTYASGVATGKNPWLTVLSSDTVNRNEKTSSQGLMTLNNAAILAGASHDQEVVIDENKITIRSALNDIIVGRTTGYDPIASLTSQIAGITAKRDAETDSAEKQLLQNQLDSLNSAKTAMQANLAGQSTVNVISVGDILAGGGDVKFKADAIISNGAQVDAYGVPVVVIRNNTKDFLVTNKIVLSTPGSGKVVSSGAADVRASGAATINEHTKGESLVLAGEAAPSVPTLLIENTYDISLPGHSGPAPAISIQGDISNLRGATVVTNISGDMYQSGRVETLTLDMKSPSGSIYINGGEGMYDVVSPEGQWYSILQGWLPSALTGMGASVNNRSVADTVAEFAANVAFNANGTLNMESLFDSMIRDPFTTQRYIYLGGVSSYKRMNSGGSSGDTVENRKTFNYGQGVWTWSGFRTQDVCDPCDGMAWNETYFSPVRPMLTNASTAYQASVEPATNAPKGIYAGKSVNINSKYINVNAPIEAGKRNDWVINLDSNTASEIAAHNSGTGLYQLHDFSATVNGAAATSTAGNADTAPMVYWDRDNQQIRLAAIDASGGGSISISGGVVNTGRTYGQLTVNSGYGKVAIDNSTGKNLYLQSLDTGDGSRGWIKITDTLQPKVNGGQLYQTTWLVNEAGSSAIQVYDNSNGATTLDGAHLVSSGSTASYNPLAGARYNWTYSYDISRTLQRDGNTVNGNTTMWETDGGCGGAAGALNCNTSGWSSSYTNPDGTIYKRSSPVIVTGQDTSDPNKYLTQTVTVKDLGYQTISVTDEKTGFLKGDQFVWVNHVALDITESLKADNPIPVRFNGATASQITVNSNAGVTFGGAVRNTAGTTKVKTTSGDILADAGAVLRTTAVDLVSAGRIGGANSADALQVVAEGDSAVTVKAAAAAGDVRLQVDGQANLDQISAGGSGHAVDLLVNGAMRQASTRTGTVITADLVNLKSTSAGGIGAAGQALTVQTKELNASAPGDIYLKQASGDMAVGLIASEFGNIELSAPSGQIVGVAPTSSAFTDELAQKIAIWESMQLSDPAHSKVQTVVQGYEGSVKRSYADYWQMRELASDTSTTNFMLTGQGVDLYRGQVTAALGLKDRTANDNEVQTAIRARYLTAYDLLSSALAASSGTSRGSVIQGAGIQGARILAFSFENALSSAAAEIPSQLTIKDTNFSYTLDTSSKTYHDMTYGLEWSKGALGASINAGADAGRPSTGAAANVVASRGRVALNNDTTNPVTAPATISFDMTVDPNSYTPTVSNNNTGYSDTQLRAFLASAKPGSLQATADGANPNRVHFTLKLRNDLVVDAKDPVAITSLSDYYLSASRDVVLKDLDVQKNLYVYAGRDVLNGTAQGTPGGVVGGLYIDAGRNIGTALAPIQVAGRGTNSVLDVLKIKAPGTVHADFLTSDVVLHDIQAGQGATLQAVDGKFLSASDTSFDGAIHLIAQAGIGSTATPFAVAMAENASVRLDGSSAVIQATSGHLLVGDSHLTSRLALRADNGRIQTLENAHIDTPSIKVEAVGEGVGAVNLLVQNGSTAGHGVTVERVESTRSAVIVNDAADQDLIVQAVAVAETLTLGAQRDILNGRASGDNGTVASLDIRAGRDAGAAGAALRFAPGNGAGEVVVQHVQAGRHGNVTISHGDLRVGNITVAGIAELVAEDGNIVSDVALLDSGLVNLRATGTGNGAGAIGSEAAPLVFQQANGNRLGLFGKSAHVTATTDGDLVMANSDLSVLAKLRSEHGRIVMASQDQEIRSVGGEVVLDAAQGIGSDAAHPVRLDTSVFSAMVDDSANPGDIFIDISNTSGQPLKMKALKAPGSAAIVLANGDFEVGKVKVGRTADLTAGKGNFYGYQDAAELERGAVQLHAQDGANTGKGQIGTTERALRMTMTADASLALDAIAGNVQASSGNVYLANATLQNALTVDATHGSVLMSAADKVLHSDRGPITLRAEQDVGSAATPLALDAPRFNALAQTGSIWIHDRQPAQVDQLVALLGSARVSVDGDGNPASTDLVIGDAAVAQGFTVAADSVRAQLRQTVGTTPLAVAVAGQGKAMADSVQLNISNAPYVRMDELNARTALIRSDAQRLNFVTGTVGETMRFSTAHVSGYMNNLTPKLDFAQDVQFYIPGKHFRIDIDGLGLANSQAPVYFQPGKGLYTTTDVTNGFGVFDINRPSEHADQHLDQDLRLPLARLADLAAERLNLPVLIQPAAAAVNVNGDGNKQDDASTKPQ